MYRIRFHGRGGQGMKTAGRILGQAFFLAGFEVQDAPRYGAERRGAPIFAYVRADCRPILERGIIRRPDLVIVADDTLPAMPAAGVLQGVGEHTLLLLHSRTNSETWQQRLQLPGPILILPIRDDRDPLYIGTICAAAAARLTGALTAAVVEEAIRRELHDFSTEVIEDNVAQALAVFAEMTPQPDWPLSADVNDSGGATDWIELPFEPASISAPAIHAAATSEQVKTGLWRTQKPVICREHCRHCWWLCSSFCPDGAITVDDQGNPHIDYDHCKGCMVCLAQCPNHAIVAVREESPDAAQRRSEP